MKFAAIIFLLFTGCAAIPHSESEFRGWSSREVGSDRFRINVGEAKKDKVEEALLFAATLSLQHGYRSFSVVDEDGKSESGTFFFWSQSYDGRAAMMSFSPGKYFTIVCRKKSPSEYETWFDAAKVLKKKPNQSPQPPLRAAD